MQRVRHVVQTMLILHIFRQPAISPGRCNLPSLGCQTLHRLGACRVLPRRGQLVPVLCMASACVRYRVRPRSERDLSRTLLATAAMASATRAHADYYASVENQWECYTTRFGEINRRHSPWVCNVGSHIACDCGCGHFVGWLALTVVGMVSKLIAMIAREANEPLCNIP